ncbi:hypothetical protein [Paracandidimonas soli]|uniref:Uncharacterized protein n=1 Tax=Paracandidimonas soli TaxID=1917182 RepID=A0A4R3UVD9_9BURK|nr:hypothetical protein [Paracandidimonas soli]TCU96115.1 hypothetical protein EV686_107173 [Paracandidimonas soli]
MSELPKFVYTAEHEFYYSTKEPVPIADVIEALQGIERMLRSLPRAIERVTEISIADSHIYVERIESGSLKEKILIKLFFKSEEELDSFLDKIRKTLDGKPMLKGSLITILIAGFIGTGLLFASKALQEPAPNITANHNVIINIGAGEVGMSPDGFRSLIESSILDKKDFAKAAVKFVKPARQDNQASIVLDDMSELSITPLAIAETPEVVNIEPISDVVEYEKATLLIRAGDMDQVSSGWAGAIQGETERLPIELDPALSPVQLFGRASKQVTADVALVRRQDGRSGKMVPKSIFVRHIYD